MKIANNGICHVQTNEFFKPTGDRIEFYAPVYTVYENTTTYGHSRYAMFNHDMRGEYIFFIQDYDFDTNTVLYYKRTSKIPVILLEELVHRRPLALFEGDKTCHEKVKSK